MAGIKNLYGNNNTQPLSIQYELIKAENHLRLSAFFYSNLSARYKNSISPTCSFLNFIHIDSSFYTPPSKPSTSRKPQPSQASASPHSSPSCSPSPSSAYHAPQSDAAMGYDGWFQQNQPPPGTVSSNVLPASYPFHPFNPCSALRLHPSAFVLPSSLFPLTSSFIHQPSSLIHQPSFFPLPSSILPLTSAITHQPSIIFHLTSSILHRSTHQPSAIKHQPSSLSALSPQPSAFARRLIPAGFSSDALSWSSRIQLSDHENTEGADNVSYILLLTSDIIISLIKTKRFNKCDTLLLFKKTNIQWK